MRSSLSLLGAAFALRGASAAIYTDPSQLPDRQYDYVVVGGTFAHPEFLLGLAQILICLWDFDPAGPGGSVVARRLAEDSTTSVLIIEAGGL